MTRTRLSTRALKRGAAAAFTGALILSPLAVISAPATAAVSTASGVTAAAGDAYDASPTPARLGIPRELWNALDDTGRATLESLAPRLPDGAALRGRNVEGATPVHAAMLRHLDRVIDPDNYVCDDTPLDAYVDGLVAELELIDIIVVALIYPNSLSYPTYDALFKGTQGDPSYALTKASKNEITQGMRKLSKFWGSSTVRTDDIHLLAMHGAMMADVTRVQDMMLYFEDSSPAVAAEDAALLTDYVVNDFPRGTDNPLWTLNAYAFTAEGDPDPDVTGLPDKIVFGDGILTALAAIGVGDVGPQAVLAHEMGHHVQFELGQPVGGSPEGTRRSELEADYLAVYFMTHKRGMARNEARVTEAITSFYDVGDCSFDNNGHHGTPNQRRKASRAGADLAREAHKQGHIMSAEAVIARFATVLPGILALDA